MEGRTASTRSRAFDPTVWTGRVLQAGCERWRGLVLRFCIRPVTALLFRQAGQRTHRNQYRARRPCCQRLEPASYPSECMQFVKTR